MTDKEVLMQAFEKAKLKGWMLNSYETYVAMSFDQAEPDVFLLHNPNPYHAIIFSHKFAKAFFGVKDYWYDTPCTCGGMIHPLMDLHNKRCEKLKAPRGYKHHLQQMVLEKNPVKYLKKFL